MHKELQGTYKGRMMIGQAGVYSVASQLILRGHVPCFPSVDTGVDLVLDNGIRIQVKGRNLSMGHPDYPRGAYNFSVKENNHGGRKRDWTKVCDFLVFWGISENRFFVIPAAEATQNFWISPRGEHRPIRDKKNLASFEDRWDLLDVGKVLKSVEETTDFMHYSVRVGELPAQDK